MYVHVGYDDRSAIIDLISAYTRLYDDAEMDEFSTLFADDVVVYPNFGSAMPERVLGKEAVVGFYAAAHKQARDAGIRTRHFSTNHLFKALAPSAAEVVAGMLYAERRRRVRRPHTIAPSCSDARFGTPAPCRLHPRDTQVATPT